ncbi:MAG: protein translocase subunit SecD [Patescibacteria group bacterium]
MKLRAKLWLTMFGILILSILAGTVTWPKGPDLKIGSYNQKLEIHQGLDLRGGTHLVYEANMEKIPENERANALEGIQTVIDRRINALGVTEPVIQTTSGLGLYRVIIELPGVTDVNQAIDLIGQTAQLEFREGIAGKSLSAEGQPQSYSIDDWKDIGLTGARFKKAQVQIDQQTFKPIISIQFDDEGAELFSQATSRNVGKPIAIFLDGVPISIPNVQTAITGGNAVISGSFTVDQAKSLSIQLNAGALPVPIKLVEQRNVGATLGQDSVHKSFVAGLIGLLAVALFMIIYYRLPGFLAVVALVIYSLFLIALFKLIPVTMTLAGIAGFILSIGMAVDANILIFERMREEMRRGRPYNTAITAGFARAWTSIRDSNASSLITCIILFYFGTGIIKGFALTLALGIVVSMFTAITVSRTMLMVLIGKKLGSKQWLFGK